MSPLSTVADTDTPMGREAFNSPKNHSSCTRDDGMTHTEHTREKASPAFPVGSMGEMVTSLGLTVEN